MTARTGNKRLTFDEVSRAARAIDAGVSASQYAKEVLHRAPSTLCAALRKRKAGGHND